MTVANRSAAAKADGNRRPRSLAMGMALVVVGAVVALLTLEGTLRLVLEHYLNPFEPDAELGYRLKPSFAGRYPWVSVRTDEEGYRVARRPGSSSGRKILFVGDSVTFGFGVEAQDAYPLRFGESIGRAADVVNAAVPGYNLQQVLLTTERFLKRQTPEFIVYGLCLNDISGAAAPATYADIDPHRRRVDRGGVLSSSFLVSFVERRFDRLARRFGPAAPAEEDVGPLLQNLSSPDLGESVRAFDHQWGELQDLRRRTGIPIVVLILPYRQQIVDHPDWRAPQEFLGRKCADGEVRCLDPWSVLIEHKREPLYNGSSSMHFSPMGHRLIAAWLVNSMARARN